MGKFESLENRQMLAAASISGSVVVITTGGGTGVDVVTLNVSSGTLTVNVNNGGVAEAPFVVPAATFGSITKINITTGAGNDTVTLNSTVTKPASILGGGGDDTITGGAGNDTILSGQNDDWVNGGNGNDLVDGGGGDDTLAGGGGNDALDYSARSTKCTVNLSTLAGGEVAAAESDQYSSMESILGGSGGDSLTGSGSADYISGGGGADTIQAGNGNDTLVGGAGSDLMYGNADNDFLFALDGEPDTVDGGPGTDSAQTDPAEAAPAVAVELALPAGATPQNVGAVAAALSSTTTTTSTTTAAKKPAPVGKPVLFSKQRIETRPKPRAVVPSIAPKSTKKTAASPMTAPLAAAAPLPGPPGFSGDEKVDPEGQFPELSQQEIVAVGQPLEPYAFGIVNTTRNFAGAVRVNGTGVDDVFVIRTQAGVAGVTVVNNGGRVDWDLPSPNINVAGGGGGADRLVIDADNAVYTPGPAPGTGTIVADGHTIQFGGLGPNPVVFQNVDNVTVTGGNGGSDVVVVGTQATDGATVVSVTTNSQPLGAVTMNGVDTVTVDTGANDGPGGAADEITVNSTGQAVAVLPGTIGNDTLHVNGAFTLTNNPAPDPAIPPTLNLFVNPNASMLFAAPRTRLNFFQMTSSQAAIQQGGGRVVTTRGLNFDNKARFDLVDNSFVFDYSQNLPPGASPIRGLIASAYQPAAPQHWNGPGIYSSIAATDAKKAVGHAESFQVLGPNGGTFRGVDVDNTATLVTFTLNGDATLDRKVDFDDLLKLAQNYNAPANRDWPTGDFNFTNGVDFDDLLVLAQNYNQSIP